MSRAIVLIGVGGHASVVADACEKSGQALAGYLDRAPGSHAIAGELPWLGGDEKLEDPAFARAHSFVIAVGDNRARRRIGEMLDRHSVELAIVIHPSAVIGARVVLGGGGFVAASAVINPGCVIGRHAIINTRASIDHDARIGDYVQIGPGAILAGDVTLDAGAVLGAGAVVRPGVRIGAEAMAGAGAVVVRDVEAGLVVAGVPAKPLDR